MIFVFEVHVHPGHTADAYAEAWIRASEIIQRRIIAEQAEFVDVRVIGEFEDPDWIVNPG